MEHYDDEDGAGGGGRPFGAGPPGMSFYRCGLRGVSTHCPFRQPLTLIAVRARRKHSSHCVACTSRPPMVFPHEHLWSW